MRIVGGHLALDLANTVEPRLPGHAVPDQARVPPTVSLETDHLTTPEALLAWALLAGVVTESEALLISAAWSPPQPQLQSPQPQPQPQQQSPQPQQQSPQRQLQLQPQPQPPHPQSPQPSSPPLNAGEAALADARALRDLIDPVLAGDRLLELTHRWSQAIARSELITPGDTPARAGSELIAARNARAGSEPVAARDVRARSEPAAARDIRAGSEPAAARDAPARTGSEPIAAARETGPARLRVGVDPVWMIPDRLADALVDLVRTADRGRLRTCPLDEGGCGWLFLDRSRNGTRRWCSMDDCGTHVKARRLTERRRARRAG